ncbi:MAG TPA: LPXTG cell wall anchor domain-containing protein [Ignavibacteriaceae bacterium]|nr:LPXTG cell wall anchor domain-containing protein [Ignavibacteriaceae bacterium]
MKRKANKFLVAAFVVVVVLFLFFGGWGMSGGIMNGGMHGRMNEIGWTGERGWVWFPTLITLILSVVLGWILFKKKNKKGSDIF